ncbi:MAG: PPC domain-containing protein [Bythopirellula sp.]
MSTYRTICSICLLITFSVLATSVQAAQPVLQRLQPQGGQRGTEVEVAFIGQRFKDGPHQILLYESGIQLSEIEAVDDKQVKCKLRLDENCRVGRHALRLRTASGLTNLFTFHVGNLKEIQESEPNDAADQPQTLETDVVVNGLVKDRDSDFYAVELAEGERLSVEIEGIRLGRTLFDPLIEVRDEAGALLASSDDQPAAQQDAFVSLRAKQAGRVIILVRESAFRGNDASTYRLHVGRFPRPAAVFPPVAVPGQANELRWIGATFDQQNVSVDVPQTDESIFAAHATDDQGISPSGIPVYLSETAPTLEIEPNNARDAATEFTAPGIAAGIISQPQDKDFYRFNMKQGETWDIRVRARGLRSPLDSVIHIYDPKGKYVKGNDDNAGQPDSYVRFKAAIDGEYTLDVEDRQLRGREEMVYVLEISKPAPIAELTLDERRRYQAHVIAVPQGGRTTAMVTVKRKDLGGPLQVEWAGLPAGCTAEAVPLAKNYHRVPVLFTAEPQAEINASLATITARLTEKPKPIASRFRQQSWLVRGRNNVHVWSHYADRASVAVTKALPYTVRAVEPKAPLVQGGSMELKIVAERNEGFDNSIAVRTLYNPPGVSTNQSRSIASGKSEVMIPITANQKARIGDWKLVFLGITSLQGSVESSTQLTKLKIVQPYFDIKIPSQTVTQGDPAELVVQLEHRTEFAGEAELELLRLPPGVTATKVKITAESPSAVFQLQVAKDARVGRHRGVGCHARFTVEGEPVRYSQGYVELRVDPSAATETAQQQSAAEGKTS